jgi:hypothetical protein
VAERRQLYVCVYCRYVPTPIQWRKTVELARSDKRLAQFLDEYWGSDSFYDWGDDPSFFSAREVLGDASRASWGVCRPEVRRSLGIGDAVAFFCGKLAVTGTLGAYRRTGPCDYFYIGCGTVGRLTDRSELFSAAELSPYRGFYNVLAKPTATGTLANAETFRPHHPDWRWRATTPIVLFDPAVSGFDLGTPHSVAHFEPEWGVPEVWHDDARSRRLEEVPFGDVQRRLRTSVRGHQHAARALRFARPKFENLRDELVGCVSRRPEGR